MTVSTLLICGWLLLIYVDPVMGLWPLLVVWAVIDVFLITPVRVLLGGRGPDDPQGPPST